MKLSKLLFASALCLFCDLDRAWAKEIPLIPREVLFGNPERTSPQISPDGKMLAYLAPDKNNVLQVWVRTVDKEDPKKLTNDQKRGIRQYYWAFDNEHLLYLQDADGDENFHLYATALKDKGSETAARDLTPFKGARAQGIEFDPDFPNELLVGLNVQNKAKFDMYRINLKGGEPKLDTENPGNVISWVADAEFKVRAATAATPDGGYDLLVREGPDKEWKKIRHLTNEEQGATVGFSKDGKTLYILSNQDANAQRLLALNLATDKESVVSEDPEYDISGALVHPTKRIIQAV